jgi:hypothetical protein
MCKAIFYVRVDVGQEELWVAIEGHKPRLVLLGIPLQVSGDYGIGFAGLTLRRLCIFVWRLLEFIV